MPQEVSPGAVLVHRASRENLPLSKSAMSVHFLRYKVGTYACLLVDTWGCPAKVNCCVYSNVWQLHCGSNGNTLAPASGSQDGEARGTWREAERALSASI